MDLLLTNDDGIESPGLAALYERLSAIAEVTVVAPTSDQSGVGRARSGVGDGRAQTVSIDDHEWGYVVDGTPADCAAVGLRRIAEAEGIDLVVSGANDGPNVGSYLLGHSGTVGAVVEGAFLGTPGIAVSGYDKAGYFPDGRSFEAIAEATAAVVERAVETDVFEGDVDVLNVNAPVAGADALRFTRPLADYDTAVRPAATDGEGDAGTTTVGIDVDDGDGGSDGVGSAAHGSDGRERARFETTYWARTGDGGKWVPSLAAQRGVYPAWSDRAAVVDGDLSITPLAVPQTVVDAPPAFVEALDADAERLLAGR